VPRLEADHIPVRGDLAHIRLAGKVFVPHYSVPMPRVIAAGGTELRRAGRDDADVMAPLDAGTVFSVLDMAGNWAWGRSERTGWSATCRWPRWRSRARDHFRLHRWRGGHDRPRSPTGWPTGPNSP
jgi:hypothetical protein